MILEAQMLVIVFCSGIGVSRGRTGAAEAVVTGTGQGTEGGVEGALSSTSADDWGETKKLKEEIRLEIKVFLTEEEPKTIHLLLRVDLLCRLLTLSDTLS